MRNGGWIFLGLLAGCGVSQERLSSDYTVAYCDYVLSCEDPALLQFDGIDSVETCQSLVAPEITSSAIGCVDYKRSLANQCLKSMEGLACPAEGASLDEGLPLACQDLWQRCGTAAVGEGSDDTGN